MNIEEKLEGIHNPSESRGVSGGALSFMAGAIIITLAGLLIGAITSLVSNLIYIVILFPLGIGFIGAVILERTIRILKIRRLLLGILLGGWVVLVIYGAYHYTGYQSFRLILSSAMNEKLVAETGEYTPEVGSVFVDYALKEETGYTGILGYMLYKAKLGVSIGRIASTRDFNLGPVFTWLYWLIELGIIGWMTIGTAKSASDKPFCERCNAWYGKEEHIGGCSASEYDKTLQVLNRQEFSRLGEMLVKDAELPSLEVYIQTCSKCPVGNPWLVLKRASLGNKGKVQFKTLLQQYISSSDKRKMIEVLDANAASSVLPPGAPISSY